MRSSHTNCKRCHVRRAHKRSKYEMCPPCRMAHASELRAARAAAKANRVHREVRAVDQEQVDVPKIRVEKVTAKRQGGRPPARVWTDEEKLEIGRLYEEGQSYEQIRQATGANTQTIANIARTLGLMKTRGPGSKTVPVPNASIAVPENGAIPEAQAKAIENMVKLPPKPEPLHSTPLLPPMLDFEVTVHGAFRVQALDIMDAMQGLIRKYPDLRITGIREAHQPDM